MSDGFFDGVFFVLVVLIAAYAVHGWIERRKLSRAWRKLEFWQSVKDGDVLDITDYNQKKRG